jgi:hypothetical protein
MVVVGKQREENVAEPVLANLLADDRTPWYRKPNLRRLYFLLFPACMGIEITSGFDSQIINTVQIVYTWNKCSSFSSRDELQETLTVRIRLRSSNREDRGWTPPIRD